MSISYDPGGTVVLTTHERSGYFTSVLGEDVDLRYDPRDEATLSNLLHNTIVAGGSLAVIDESFFMDTDDLAMGLERFLREEIHPERLRIIVVCTKRKEGDLFLAYLVMYCGIYNIIYGKTGVGVSVDLEKLVKRDNTRFDVLHLADAWRWSAAKHASERTLAIDGRTVELVRAEREAIESFAEIHEEYLVDVRGLSTLSVRVRISALPLGA